MANIQLKSREVWELLLQKWVFKELKWKTIVEHCMEKILHIEDKVVTT